MIFNWEAVLSTVCYSAKWLGNHYDSCWWKALLLYICHCLGLCQCTFHLNRLCLILTVCVGQGRKVIVWLMAQSVLYQMVNDALFLSWAPLSWPPLAQANWTRTFQWPPQPHFVCLFDALLKVCLSGWRMLLLRPKKWAAGHSVSLHYLFAQAHSVITHMLLLTVMAQIDFEGSLLPNSIKAAFLSSKSLPLGSCWGFAPAGLLPFCPENSDVHARYADLWAMISLCEAGLSSVCIMHSTSTLEFAPIITITTAFCLECASPTC